MTKVRDAVGAVLRGAAAQQRALKYRNGTLCAVALTLGLAGGAHAQEAPAAGTSAGTGSSAAPLTLDEVTVTGSRIRRTTDFDTANPTTVVDGDFLKNLGVVNVSQAIEQLPANVSTFSPTNTGNSSFFSGSTIANLRGLNPYFGSRTLNLVNSRRFVPTNQGDGVDLNFIPSVLIERVDVVTGGASAAYGSGAISGVNNIFLNRRLEGGRAEVDFGESDESDARDRHVGLAYGMGFLDDRAHFTVAYEYQKSDAVGCVDARDWCRKSVGFYQDPTTGGLILGSDVRRNQISTTGVLVAAPGATTTLQADAAGTGTTTFHVGTSPDPTGPGASFNNVVGGDGDSIYHYTNLRAPVDRNVAAGTFTYDLTDTTHLSIDVSWGKVETVNYTGALASQMAAISGENPFVQANSAIYQAIGGTPGSVGFINKDWSAQVDARSEFSTDVKRAAIGLDGRFGDSSWGWDGYYQYGKTSREQKVIDNLHLNQYLMALDAVEDANGNIVCRVTRDGFDAAIQTAAGQAYATANPILANGCVPINPFGTQAISDAARAYAFGNLDEVLDYEQQVLALNASGDLFEGFGAGPIQAALGAEYRIEEGENIAHVPPGTTDATRTDYLVQYGDSFAGKVYVTEGYLETNVPVLRDVTGAQRLEFDMAVRESRYKNKGGFGTTGLTRTHDMTTWKISGIWDPVDWLRVRASQSRDSRAANFRELYYGQKLAAGGAFAYCGPAGSFHVDPCNWSLEGNVDLKPEKSDTTTLGLVFTPKDWLPGFQFAADYFRIRIRDAIEQASVNGVLDGCRIDNDPADCALIEFDGTQYVFNGQTYDGIAGLRALAFNGAGYIYKGVDFSGSYLWELSGGDLISFRLLATRMIDQKFQPLPGADYVNVVGQTGTGNSFLSDNQPTAKWNANLSATWTHGPLALTGQVRYVSDGIMDYLGALPGEPVPENGRTLSVNHVPSYQVFMLSGNYTFENVVPMHTLQLWAVVNNVFDKDPPVAVGGGAFGPSNGFGGTNPIFFDTMGRTIKVGLRTTF